MLSYAKAVITTINGVKIFYFINQVFYHEKIPNEKDYHPILLII